MSRTKFFIPTLADTKTVVTEFDTGTMFSFYKKGLSMCFSAQASFTAAVGLTIIGGFTIAKARRTNMRFFAAAPLFFAFQQLCEGFVWITLNAGDTTSLLHKLSVYSFTFFADAFWPLAVPTVMYSLETQPTRKRLLSIVWLGGALVALTSLIVSWSAGIAASSASHHISYHPLAYGTQLSSVYTLYMSLYTLATIGSIFISSVQYMWLVGVLVSLGFLAAQISYHVAFGSVWCFFAALISAAAYLVIARSKKAHQ